MSLEEEPEHEQDDALHLDDPEQVWVRSQLQAMEREAKRRTTSQSTKQPMAANSAKGSRTAQAVCSAWTSSGAWPPCSARP